MTRILVDENIPWAETLLSNWGELEAFRGRDLRRDLLGDADILLVRSVTEVNAALLEGSVVRFVGSTTIGTDHLDTRWLDQQGIRWCSAPGSNADSVVDYCLSAFCALPGALERLLDGALVGIIGYGNVGARLHRRLAALGVACLAYDPWLSAEQCPVLAPLERVLDCEIISLHTPLTRGGPFPTRHLLGLDDLLALPSDAILLNAGRGEVLATDTLLSLRQQRPDIQLVLDVWEGEPGISADLVSRCAVATPHIAGYSQDGKWRGLLQVARQLALYLGEELPAVTPPLAPAPLVDLSGADSRAALIRSLVLGVYDIREDDRRLRDSLEAVEPARAFDQLRRHYPARREVTAARLTGAERLAGDLGKMLAALTAD